MSRHTTVLSVLYFYYDNCSPRNIDVNYHNKNIRRIKQLYVYSSECYWASKLSDNDSSKTKENAQDIYPEFNLSNKELTVSTVLSFHDNSNNRCIQKVLSQ